MSQPVPRDVLAKIRKLALLPEEARRCQFAVSVTRLTSSKSLCREPAVANRFVTWIAGKALERAVRGQRRSGPLSPEQDQAHREMMGEALAEMEGWPDDPPEARRRQLLDLLGRMQAEQNEHRSIPFGTVRLIRDWELLIVEKAARCLLSPSESGHWAYQIARDYAERCHGSHGTGLIPESAPLLEDILAFWSQELGLDQKTLSEPDRARKVSAKKPPARAGKVPAARRKKARFTHRQGQFLAFIHLYRKLNRQGPAELDMVEFFRVKPPSVHGMVVKLEDLGLIVSEPGVPRSARVAIPEEDIPFLEDVEEPSG